jgi:hypothetical protein
MLLMPIRQNFHYPDDDAYHKASLSVRCFISASSLESEVKHKEGCELAVNKEVGL